MTKSFDESIRIFDLDLGYGRSFDIKKADLYIGTKKAVLYYIDGFVKKEELIKLKQNKAKKF